MFLRNHWSCKLNFTSCHFAHVNDDLGKRAQFRAAFLLLFSATFKFYYTCLTQTHGPYHTSQGRIRRGAIGVIAPLNPMKITLFAMVLYNPENNIRDIRPFGRLLFFHTSVMMYTSSLILVNLTTTEIAPPLTLLAGSDPDTSYEEHKEKCLYTMIHGLVLIRTRSQYWRGTLLHSGIFIYKH